MQSLDFILFMGTLGLIAIFALMFILSGLKMVPPFQRAVILRLGMYKGIKGPGIIWIVPILDKIVIMIPIQEQTTEIDLSSAGISRRLQGFVQWKVVEEEKFALSIQDHLHTIQKTIQYHVMKVAEDSISDADFADTEELNYMVKISLEPTFRDWGLQIIKVDLRVTTGSQ